MNFSSYTVKKVHTLIALVALCAMVLIPFAMEVRAQAAPQGTITVNKVIVGTTSSTTDDFSFLINGSNETQFEADGSNEVMLNAGTYTITEPAVDGFDTTYSGCVSINLIASGTATCTITNTVSTSTAPEFGILEIVKVIMGTTTATADDFTFDVVRNSVTPVFTNQAFEADGTNTSELPVGLYTITEDAASGFTTSYTNSNNANVNCTNLTVSANATTTCVITNTVATSTPTTTPETGTLVINKVRINGGPDATSSFQFAINGSATTSFNSNGTNVLQGMATGTYTISEVPFANYSPSYSNCSGVVINQNATTTCTITNTFNQGGGQLYEITGIVWHDEDEDGTIDGGEDRLQNWTVTATQVGEINRVDTTDANGRYTLLVTDGQWTVSQMVQSAWNQTYPVGNGNHTVNATGTATGTIPLGDYNFGNDREEVSSGGGGGGGGNGIRVELRDRDGNDDDDDDNGGGTGDDDDDNTSGGGGGTVVTPPGIVLGDQTSQFPYGAPNTGFGGGELQKMKGTATLPLLSMILVLLLGFGVARAYYDEEEKI